jgi:hypothetical protein
MHPKNWTKNCKKICLAKIGIDRQKTGPVVFCCSCKRGLKTFALPRRIAPASCRRDPGPPGAPTGASRPGAAHDFTKPYRSKFKDLT